MPSHALEVLKGNLVASEILRDIHSWLRSPDPSKGGRPLDFTQVLHKGAILLITSSWEAYVEDVCGQGFDALLDGVVDPKNLPDGPRRLIAQKLKDDKHELRIWDLAGDAWVDTCNQFRDEVLEHWTGRWNSPRSDAVDDLARDLLGIQKLTQRWTWAGTSAATARRKLDALVDRRGDLAHRGPWATKVLKKDVAENLALVQRLGERTDRAVSQHLITMGLDGW